MSMYIGYRERFVVLNTQGTTKLNWISASTQVDSSFWQDKTEGGLSVDSSLDGFVDVHFILCA